MTTCAYLTGGTILACRANLRLYVPSMAELDAYCTNGKHDVCPVYNGKTFGSSEFYPARENKNAVGCKAE